MKQKNASLQEENDTMIQSLNYKEEEIKEMKHDLEKKVDEIREIDDKLRQETEDRESLQMAKC